MNLRIPGVREKFVYRFYSAVPRTDTGALAEKAKTCKDNLVKGTRHIGPVASVEGVSMIVFEILRHL